MAQPQAYNRTKNFIENTSERTDHNALNAELDRVSQSVNGLRTNLALIQADDGKLGDAVVPLDALTPEAVAALQVPGPRGEQGIQGVQGIQGLQGVRGERGASFDANVRDVQANRSLFDLQPKGFSFLALDVGELYFKLSSDAGDWSAGYTYGKGDKGDQGEQGIQGIQGIQGLQGLQGVKGDNGAPGINGADGLVVSVDASNKTASLIGRTSITARLVIEAGVLGIVITTG